MRRRRGADRPPEDAQPDARPDIPTGPPEPENLPGWVWLLVAVATVGLVVVAIVGLALKASGGMNQREFWDDRASTFDDEPDHGLGDPATREAWRQLLNAHLPMPPSDVVDLGCGTGTLSVLLAEAGHHVRGVDLAPKMVAAARAKAAAAGLEVAVSEGDAADPPYDADSCDVVLSRHVLWALPDPLAALNRWATLLHPGGRLVLVEGRWHTGGGIAAADCLELLGQVVTVGDVQVVPLTDEIYWGGAIADERYLLTARTS